MVLAMLTLATDGASMWRAFVHSFRDHLTDEQSRVPMILLVLACAFLVLVNVRVAKWMVRRYERTHEKPTPARTNRRNAA